MTVLHEMFTRLRAAGLEASPTKCKLAMDQLLYLGHIVTVTRKGALPVPMNVQIILEATHVLEVGRLPGTCTYYDEFSKGYAILCTAQVQ